jgi:hypothetical protein
MNNFNNINPSKIISNLNIIFLALISGQVFYLLVGLFIIQSGDRNGMTDLNQIFMFIIPVINVSLILAAKFIYRKNLTNLDKSLPLKQKINSFQSNNIIKLALFEGANIVNISIMIITGSYFFAALFVVIIALFLLNKPTKEKFIMEYEISPNDVIKVLE